MELSQNRVAYDKIFNLCLNVKVLLEANKDCGYLPQEIANQLESSLKEIKVGEFLNGN